MRRGSAACPRREKKPAAAEDIGEEEGERKTNSLHQHGGDDVDVDGRCSFGDGGKDCSRVAAVAVAAVGAVVRIGQRLRERDAVHVLRDALLLQL